MTNIKKSIDMHYKIDQIEKTIIDLDYPLNKNLDLDSELKNIFRSCTRIKKLIETNKIVFMNLQKLEIQNSIQLGF